MSSSSSQQQQKKKKASRRLRDVTGLAIPPTKLRHHLAHGNRFPLTRVGTKASVFFAAVVERLAIEVLRGAADLAPKKPGGEPRVVSRNLLAPAIRANPELLVLFGDAAGSPLHVRPGDDALLRAAKEGGSGKSKKKKTKAAVAAA
jgi:hypothetical protein